MLFGFYKFLFDFFLRNQYRIYSKTKNDPPYKWFRVLNHLYSGGSGSFWFCFKFKVLFLVLSFFKDFRQNLLRNFAQKSFLFLLGKKYQKRHRSLRSPERHIFNGHKYKYQKINRYFWYLYFWPLKIFLSGTLKLICLSSFWYFSILGGGLPSPPTGCFENFQLI